MFSSNTIHKLTFDVASTDRRTDGHAMSEWIRTALVPVIDKVINHAQHEQHGGLKSRRIDKLEIDLGTVYQHEAAAELSRRLHAKLSVALEFDVDVDVNISLDDPKQSTRDEHFEQLHFFLRTGQIEWKYATHPSVAHTQLLQKVIDFRTRSSLEKLRALVFEPKTLTRMVKQFQTPQLFQLVRRFLEDWSEETSTAILDWLTMELGNIRSAPSTSILANYADKLWAWILPLTAEHPITFSQFTERSSELTDETFTQNLARHRKALGNGRGMSEAMRSGLLEQVTAMQRDHFNRMDSTATKHLNVRTEKALSTTLRQTLFATSSATHDSSEKRDNEHDPRAQERPQHPTHSSTDIAPCATDWISIVDALITADDIILERYWIELFEIRPELVIQTRAQAWKRWLEKLPIEKCIDLAAFLQPDVFHFLQSWANVRHQTQDRNSQHNDGEYADTTRLKMFLEQALPQLLEAAPMQLTVRDLLQHQNHFAEHVMAQMRTPFAETSELTSRSLLILHRELSTLFYAVEHPTESTPPKISHTFEPHEVLHALITTDITFLSNHWEDIITSHVNAVREAYPCARLQWLEQLSLTQLTDLAPLVQTSAANMMTRLLAQIPTALHQPFLKTKLPQLFLEPLDSVSPVQLLPTLREWLREQLLVSEVDAVANMAKNSIDILNTGAKATAITTNIDTGYTAAANDVEESELLYQALLNQDHALLASAWPKLLQTFPELIVRARPVAWQRWTEELSDLQLQDIAQQLQVNAYAELSALTSKFSPNAKQRFFKVALPHLLAAPPDTVQFTQLLANVNALRAILDAHTDLTDTTSNTTVLAECQPTKQATSLATRIWKENIGTERNEAHEARLLRALNEADSPFIEHHWQQILSSYTHLIVATQAQAWPKWIAHLSEEKCLTLAHFLQKVALDFLFELTGTKGNTLSTSLSEKQKKALIPYLLSSKPSSISPNNLLAEFPFLAEQFAAQKDVIDQDQITLHKNTDAPINALLSADNTALDAHWQQIIHARPHLIVTTQEPKGLSLNNVPQDFSNSLNTILQEEKFEILQTWWPKILLSHREALRKNWLLLSIEKKNRLMAVFSPSQQCDLVSVLQPHLAHFFYDYHHQLGKLINQAQLATQQSVSDVKYEATPELINALEQARTLAIDAALSSTLQPEAPRLGVSTILRASLSRIVSEFPSMLDKLNTPEMAQHSRHISAFFDAKNSIRRHMTEIDPDLHSFRLWQQGELAIADQDLNVAQLRRWLKWWMLHTTDIPETQEAPGPSTHIMLDTILEKSENSGQVARFLKLVLEALRLDTTIDLELITQQIESDETSQIDSAADASSVVDTRSPFLFTDSHNTPSTAQSRRLVEPMPLLEDIRKGDLDIAYLNSAELTHLLQASEFYRTATSDSTTSDRAAQDLVSCLETQAFAAQRPREVLQKTLAAQLHQQVITTEGLLATIEDHANPNNDFMESEDSQEHVKFAQTLQWNRETQQQFRQLIDRGLRRSTTPYTSQLSEQTTVSARGMHETVIHKPAVSTLPPQMIESLGYRISTAILRRDLASLDLIWPEILRYHSDTLLQGLRRYLGQPQALQEFLKALTVQQQLDIVHAISAKSSALLADLILAYEHRPQVFGQSRSKEEWQALLVNTSLHFLIENAAEPEAHLSTDVSVPVKSPSNMNQRASLGALFTTLVSSTEKNDRDLTLLRRVATHWHDALASQDLPNLQNSLRLFLFDDAYLEKLMVQASAQGTSLASLSSWQSLYIEELLQTSPQLLEALLAKICRDEIALSNLSTDAFHQLCHLRLGQHTETVQTTFWRKLITDFTELNHSIDTIESSPSTIAETSMSSRSSMNGSEEFSRTQYQEALQFLLSQPTIRAIESSVLSTASVINSGLSASLVTVMPDLIPHQEFDFRSINTSVQIESGITDIQSSPFLENLDCYTTLAATNTRSKTLKRDSALRDEERLCLLLQTQQQISALDEQIMELLLQRLLSATAAGTKYQSLMSALQSRSVLSRLFAHLPLSTIQRLLHQLASSQAEILPAFAEQTLVALGHKSKNSTLIAWQVVYDALFAQGLLVRGERDRTAFIRSFVHALKHKTIIENEAQSVQKILSHFERARSVSTKEVKDAKDLSKRANPTIYKSAKDLLEENSMAPAIIGEAYVHNAGIVLVAPYLQRLWGILELTANGSFIDDTAAQRAVHLLQYIVTGKSETPEYQLVLNKLLCGIHGGLPIALGINITTQEKEVIEQMLKGIIANWTALGTTSVQGLRETFLQRQAYLDYADDAWHMKVQPSTFDMLLDRLPWSFALIRFPWMTAPLHVTWR